MSEENIIELTRPDIFDLVVADREVRTSCGVGFIPPAVQRVFEKIAYLGYDAVNGDEVRDAWAEWCRAKEQFIIQK